MDNIEGFYKKTTKVNGKPVEILVSKYDKDIIITDKTPSSEKSKLISLSNKRAEQGYTSLKIGYGTDTLQSPSNKWMVQEDAIYYKLPETQKGVPEKKHNDLLTGINVIDGELVYAHYGDNLVKFIRMGKKNAPYNFINVEESKAIPYHLYILKNKDTYIKENPSLVAWATDISKGINTNIPAPNNNSSEQKSSINATSMLDFDGNSNMLDSDIASKFLNNHVDMGRHLGHHKHHKHHKHHANQNMQHSFSGGAMPDFNGGDSACDGTSSVTGKSSKKSAPKDKVVYTEAEMKAIHAKSGNKKPFLEWLKSDNAKNLASSAVNIALNKLSSKQGSGTSSDASSDSGSDSNNDVSKKGVDTEKKIAGLHPITFGIVATILGVAVIGGIWYYSKHKGVKLTPTA